MNGTEDEFVPEEESEVGPALVKRLREKLKKAVEEKQEYLEGWQRARADFANYKKEEATLHADREDRIKAHIVEELLPALDALELSLKHEKNPTLQMIERQFLDALKRMGVERFGSVGEEFDPTVHEALAKNGEDHTITEIARSGYKIDNTIIRAAQVIL